MKENYNINLFYCQCISQSFGALLYIFCVWLGTACEEYTVFYVIYFYSIPAAVLFSVISVNDVCVCVSESASHYKTLR